MSDSHKLSLIMSSSHSGRVTGPKCHPHSAAAAVATTIVLSFIVWVMGGGIMGTEKPRCWDPHAEILRRRRWYNNNIRQNPFLPQFGQGLYIYTYTTLPDCTYTHAIDTSRAKGTQISDYSRVFLASECIYIYICARGYCDMNRWDVRKRYEIVVCS